MALIDKASLLMVPSTYEAGKLYNVLPSGNRAPDSTDQNSGYDQTRADFDFDRGSNAAATRVNASGLIEKYRENLLTYSNDFSNAAWDKNIVTLAGNQSDKDGGTDAWKITANSTGLFRRLQQTTNKNELVASSIYAKAGTADHIYLVHSSGSYSSGGYQFFDLSNGTLGASSFIKVIDASIESVGNGWYRCTLISQADAQGQCYFGLSDGDTDTTITNGNYIYIQSAQLESGLVASSYLDSTSVTGKAGVLVDLPRINYDANGQNGALLLEPSRANLYTYSEYSGAWNKTNWTTTDNYAISPEGVKNAFRAVSLNTSGILYVSGTGVTGQKNTLSVWAKSNTGSDQKFRFFTDGNTNTSSDFTATTEWQRFEYTHDCTFVTAGIKGASSELSDILFYGFQHEAGSYVSSYIPTMGTSETRAADSCSVTGVSDVIGQTEGTLFLEFDHRYMSSYPNEYIIDIEDGTNKIWIRKESAGSTLTSRLIVGGSNIWTIAISATDGAAKIALAYKSGDNAVYYNGSQVGTSSATYAGNSFSDIYFNLVGSSNPELKAKNLTLFKERLSNAELATLTTL